VYWKAVTYKTVIGYGALAVALIAAGFYVVKPEFYQALFRNSRRPSIPKSTPRAQIRNTPSS